MFKLRRSFVAMTALLALLGFTNAAAVPQNRLDRALRDGKVQGHAQRVIVTAEIGGEARVRELLAKRGARIEAELAIIDAVTVTLSAADLIAVCEKNSAVRSCSIDGEVTSLDSDEFKRSAKKEEAHQPYPAVTASSTLLGTLGLPYAGAGQGTAGGRGVTVALIDSGIDPTMFANRISAFYNFTGGSAIEAPPSDQYGHGTHLAGLIGGNQLAIDAEYQGVAPGVKFVGLKVLDQDGRGFTTDVISAIGFAVLNKAAMDIDIINLSLGHPVYAPAFNDPLVQAVEKASEAGIIVVVSAGNFGADPTGKLGYAGITSPGNAPSAITVGAVDHQGTLTLRDNRVADYSSSGPTWYDGYAKPDVVAPGHYLASETAQGSTLSTDHPGWLTKGPSGKQFIHLSGTSMSTAVTTGVVALLKEKRSDLTPNLAKGLLQYTAIPLRNDNGRLYNRLRQGNGEVNAAGALAMVVAIQPGIATLDPADANAEALWWGPAGGTLANQSTQIGRRTYAWASNIVWGNDIVWGNSVLYNLPVWGLNIVWGDTIVWGNGLAVGQNIVWGNNIAWARRVVWGKDLIAVKSAHDNIVWGNLGDDNIVWGNLDANNIVWGNLKDDDNIVWGNLDADNIVWGNVVLTPAKGGK